MSSTGGKENSSDEVMDFYDVAAKFVEEVSQSDQPHRLLKSWAQRFPEHASDLASVAYARIVEANAPNIDASAADQAAVVAAAMRIVGKTDPIASPITSIKQAAEAAGLTYASLAKRLRVDLIIMAKLEQRLLKVASIPLNLVEQLADALERSTEDVNFFLTNSPRLAKDADYRSDRPPTVSDADQQTFKEAVKSSRVIASNDREYWLALLESEDPQQ